MAKTNLKNKKGFNWNRVWYFIKSLFNNQIAKEIGVKYWLPSIFLVLVSVTLVIIPTAVTESTKKGSYAVNTSSNDLIQDILYKYSNSSNDESSDLYINDHKLLRMDDKTSQEVVNYSNSNNKVGIFYLDTDNTLNGTFQAQRNAIITNYSDYTGYIFFGNEYFSLSLYKDSSKSTTICTAVGGYNNLENISSLKNYLKQNVKTSDDINTQKSTIMTNFYTFVDKSYLDVRFANTMTQVGLLAGLAGGITIIMSLVLFLTSRGKNNPSSTLKFYEVMGVAFYISITPALLSMILGFLFGGSFDKACMIYIMTYGFRCMWLAMKYLRPQYQ